MPKPPAWIQRTHATKTAPRYNHCIGPAVKPLSKLDLAKEQISYLKMWLGIAVASGLSLIGWTASNIATLSIPFLLALGFVIAMSYRVHKAKQQKIKRFEKL